MEWRYVIDPDDIELLLEQYLDIDDDEYSLLGAAIFRQRLGISIEEVLDAEDTDSDV